MAEARADLNGSVVRQAALGGCLRLGQGPGPTWKPNGFGFDPASVGRAREFAFDVLADVPKDEQDHVDTVAVVVSELITNGVRHAAVPDRRLELGIAVLPRWSHVLVEDPVPKAPDIPEAPVPAEDGAPAEEPDLDAFEELLSSGRGLGIVRDLTVRFRFVERTTYKTAHAVVLRKNVTLTAAEHKALDRLVIV